MKSIYIKIIRWIAWVLLTLIVVIVAGLSYFYIKKDDLTKELLLKANASIQGELVVTDLAIDLTEHFPRIALELEEVSLYEHKGEAADSTITPVIELAELDVSFDIIKLLNSEVEITELSLENGKLYLQQDEQGSFNLEKAIRSNDQDSIPNVATKTDNAVGQESNKLPSGESSQKSKTNSGSPNGVKTNTIVPDQNKNKDNQALNALAIDEMELQNIQVVIDMATSEQQRFSLEFADASFNYIEDNIEAEMVAKWYIDRLGLDATREIEDEELLTAIDFNYDQGEKYINIYQSDIEFRNAHFYTDGTLDLKEKGMADLNFEAGDDELAFTQLFLTSEGIDNLKSGKLYFNGTVQGPLRDQIPKITINFGADDLNIELPKTGEYLRELNIDGRFNSGTREDLSEAVVYIDTLHAVLPTGYMRMASVINNFKDPRIHYDLDASFRLDNLSRFIDLGPVDSLVGGVQINDSYRGSIRGPLPEKDKSAEHFKITLDKLSFNIPDVININELSGVISGNIDTLRLDTLRIRSLDSDLEVTGVLKELSNMIFDQDTLVLADLKIRSQKFNFPILFKALPKTSKAFPYVIRDVSINVGVETSMESLENFWKVPEMDFEIREVAASADSLLDYVRLRDGNFKMYEKDRSYFLDFNDFKLLTDGNFSDAEFQFISKEGQRDSMNLSLNSDGINLFQLLKVGGDSLPGFTDAWISGQYQGSIVMPYDHEVDQFIHEATLEVDNFNYVAKDTIIANEFNFQTRNVAYTGETAEEILASLKTENDLHFGQLKTSFFQADSLSLAVNTQDGVFSVSPQFHDELGDAEEGTIYINFSQDPPKFSLDYTINSLPLEEFLETFYSEDLLNGNVDIKLDLDATGLDLPSITSSLSGSIYVVGDSLKLKGLNLDDVIKDFQRSQSFNLVDIGAIALAGPAGIVYSKGSSYVSLLTADTKDSTLISKFSSRWLLDSGKISADDVAFATLKNRVAVQGWLDMKTDSLDMTIGIINEKGCAIFDQRVYGKGEDPEYSKVKFIKTLLAPVTNVIKGAVGAKCDVFYNGTVTHPVEPRKKKDKAEN